MSQVIREVSWGEGLVVATFRTPGGLRHAVDVIRRTVGVHIGSRSTFAKLYQVRTPDELGPRDLFRAWLLLAAVGEDPTTWGVPTAVVPTSMDAVTLRTTLADACAVRDSNSEPAGQSPDTLRMAA